MNDLFCLAQLNITDCERALRVTVSRKQLRLRPFDNVPTLRDSSTGRAVLDDNGLFQYDWKKFELNKKKRTAKQYQVDDDGVIIRDSNSVERAVRRARVMLVDLATLNNFDYFGTITIDNDKHDILDISGILDKLLKWCNNYQQRISNNFQYIIVPEFGSKTHRLHFHFLMKGICEDDLFINEHNYLDFRPLKERFGFIQITKIGNTDDDRLNVAKYCSKYMGKDNVQIRSHRYFCSSGLKRPSKFSVLFSTVANAVSYWLLKNGVAPYSACQYGWSWSLIGDSIKRFKAFVSEKIREVKFNLRLWEDFDDLETPFDGQLTIPMLS